jgi:oligopeptide/dipeptide ABC transporter ATP-binding protein
MSSPGGPHDPAPLLRISGLTTAFPRRDAVSLVVRDLSFELDSGQVLGLVGESGSGKSVTLRSILGLVPSPGAIVAGSVSLDGVELVGLSQRALRRFRGRVVSMIFQDPASALNPVFSIGDQIAETVRAHLDVSRAEARAEALTLLERVGIPSPRARLRAYPHELSGGMRQRAMIATAIACRPRLILADEPTTNLDVTIQDQILHLLAELRAEQGAAMILVSHDLGVVAQNADVIAVMYAGWIVERASTSALFENPRHPYTRGLIGALPTLRAGSERHPLTPIPGQPPDVAALPEGCPFQPRCPLAREACRDVDMQLIEAAPGHVTACPFTEPPAA